VTRTMPQCFQMQHEAVLRDLLVFGSLHWSLPTQTLTQSFDQMRTPLVSPLLWVCPAQMQPLPQLPSAPPAAAATDASPRPFDVVLLSIVRVTDDLSNAADSLLELMELTAAADSTLAGDAGDLLNLSNNGSSISSTSQAAGAVQLTQILHSSTAPSAPALADAGGSLQLPAADRQIGASTGQRMSQQALAVAAEALRLATLLEGQQDGCDPAEQELLQQVAAAARLVSILAADIVQPAEQGGADFTLSTSSGSPARAVAAESTAGAADDASSISRTELHSFAGLPVLGLQVSDSSCGMPAGTAAALPTQCLHL